MFTCFLPARLPHSSSRDLPEPPPSSLFITSTPPPHPPTSDGGGGKKRHLKPWQERRHRGIKTDQNHKEKPDPLEKAPIRVVNGPTDAEAPRTRVRPGRAFLPSRTKFWSRIVNPPPAQPILAPVQAVEAEE